jgi:hypothetical protein
MSIQHAGEIHTAVTYEVQSSIALRLAVVTTLLLVLVGFGGYFLGIGKTIREARESAKAAASSERAAAESYVPPPTLSHEEPEIIQKLPAPPPLPNR